MAWDLALYNTKDGSDLQLIGKDFSIFYGWENFIYMGLFGGNIEMSTKGDRVVTEQAFDYWGNRFLFPNDEGIQFNSTTERVLKTTALNSSGRLKINEALKFDLRFMSTLADISTDVQIVSDDRVRMTVLVKQPDNLQAKEFIFLWDATKQELINDPSYRVRNGDFDTNDFTNDFY